MIINRRLSSYSVDQQARIKAAFWARVDIVPNTCWKWKGSLAGNNNYGIFAISVERREKPHLFWAHRLSFEIVYGDIKDGLSICHRCDTPTCTKPECLFAGTHLQNMRDAKAKGHLLGPRHLTPLQVIAIRERVAGGEGQAVLAIEFKVSAPTISSICVGRHYKDVGGPVKQTPYFSKRVA